jgi:hypothetical protein
MSTSQRAVHVATIKRKYQGKTHLLGHTYGEDDKFKYLTVGNLSYWPHDLIDVLRKRLAGEPLPAADGDFEIVRSLPHGHFADVLGLVDAVASCRRRNPGQNASPNRD